MDIGFSAADRDVRARARALAENHLFPVEEELDANDHLSPEKEAAIRQAVIDHRLNAVNHAVEWGGQGLTIVQQMIVNEEVGKAIGKEGKMLV